jgi:hypothetical protein
MADTGVARILEPAVPATPVPPASAARASTPVDRSAPPDVRRVHTGAIALATALDDDERERAALEAGSAIGDLAAEGRADDLRSVLTPEPSNANVTWTVSCYQVGDLAPSGMHDFADPVVALDCLVACPDASHIAGELIASTRNGLCWTALTRTNEQLRFQLPGPSTLHDTGDGHAGAAALRAWDEQLSRWLGGDAELGADTDEARDGVDVDLSVDSHDGHPLPLTPEVVPAADPDEWPGAMAPAGGELVERLDGLTARLGSAELDRSWLVDRIVSVEVTAAVNERRLADQLDAIERRLGERLEAIERRLDGLEAASTPRRDDDLGARLEAIEADVTFLTDCWTAPEDGGRCGG